MDSNLSIGGGVPLTLVRAVEIALINSPKPEQAVQAILAAEPHVLNFLLRRNRARRNLLALKSFRPDHSLTGTIGFDANGNAVKKQFSFGQIALE